MSSIIPGFEYDIYISYRQHDNRYEGWVTEFITKLQQELEATVKDKLSIYFDENPVEGLGESHDVDHSLVKKMKALIFIPIISQTYCDRESFAWKGEFMYFKQQAINDQFGLLIDLPNGNVAGRILPIKIHEIDIQDIRLLEAELSGVLRSIDFIYQSAGVNRPLRPVDDDMMNNFNKTIYRNQINKVANAVKDLIAGIKNAEAGTFVKGQSIGEGPSLVVEPRTAHVTVPNNISYQIVNKEKTTVYLAWTSADLKSKREEVALTLQKAGFNVVPGTDCPAEDEAFKNRVRQEMGKGHCSLHILSGEFGRRFELEDEKSFPQFQFEAAMERSSKDEFHTFIWYIQEQDKPLKPDQAEFIKFIRNNITRNMTFSNSMGPMQLVDDMRAIMRKEVEDILDTKDTDIFFIFNQQDEFDAQSITDFISDEYPVEIMNILPDGEDEYRELSRQQIPRSKLAVIYFRYAADWALPFIKQVWKSVGGASSPTPIMLVGEDDPETNRARKFKAPKVVCTIVPKQNVPDEIKRVYTHVLKMK